MTTALKSNVAAENSVSSSTDVLKKRKAGRPLSLLRLITADRISQMSDWDGDCTVSDLADLFGVTTQTIRYWSKNGYLPAGTRNGDRVTSGLSFKVEDVRKCIERVLRGV